MGFIAVQLWVVDERTVGFGIFIGIQDSNTNLSTNKLCKGFVYTAEGLSTNKDSRKFSRHVRIYMQSPVAVITDAHHMYTSTAGPELIKSHGRCQVSISPASTLSHFALVQESR